MVILQDINLNLYKKRKKEITKKVLKTWNDLSKSKKLAENFNEKHVMMRVDLEKKSLKFYRDGKELV